MERLLQILKIIFLFLLLPLEIFKGKEKKAYVRIKKLMVAANLL